MEESSEDKKFTDEQQDLIFFAGVHLIKFVENKNLMHLNLALKTLYKISSESQEQYPLFDFLHKNILDYQENKDKEAEDIVYYLFALAYKLKENEIDSNLEDEISKGIVFELNLSLHSPEGGNEFILVENDSNVINQGKFARTQKKLAKEIKRLPNFIENMENQTEIAEKISGPSYWYHDPDISLLQTIYTKSFGGFFEDFSYLLNQRLSDFTQILLMPPVHAINIDPTVGQLEADYFLNYKRQANTRLNIANKILQDKFSTNKDITIDDILSEYRGSNKDTLKQIFDELNSKTQTELESTIYIEKLNNPDIFMEKPGDNSFVVVSLCAVGVQQDQYSGGQHWGFLEIKFILDDTNSSYKVQVFFHDPQGRGTLPDAAFQKIKQSIELRAQEENLIINTITNETSSCEKRQADDDGAACAAIAMQMMFEYISESKIGNTRYPKGAKELRLNQAKMLDPLFEPPQQKSMFKKNAQPKMPILPSAKKNYHVAKPDDKSFEVSGRKFLEILNEKPEESSGTSAATNGHKNPCPVLEEKIVLGFIVKASQELNKSKNSNRPLSQAGSITVSSDPVPARTEMPSLPLLPEITLSAGTSREREIKENIDKAFKYLQDNYPKKYVFWDKSNKKIRQAKKEGDLSYAQKLFNYIYGFKNVDFVPSFNNEAVVLDDEVFELMKESLRFPVIGYIFQKLWEYCDTHNPLALDYAFAAFYKLQMEQKSKREEKYEFFTEGCFLEKPIEQKSKKEKELSFIQKLFNETYRLKNADKKEEIKSDLKNILEKNKNHMFGVDEKYVREIDTSNLISLNITFKETKSICSYAGLTLEELEQEEKNIEMAILHYLKLSVESKDFGDRYVNLTYAIEHFKKLQNIRNAGIKKFNESKENKKTEGTHKQIREKKHEYTFFDDKGRLIEQQPQVSRIYDLFNCTRDLYDDVKKSKNYSPEAIVNFNHVLGISELEPFSLKYVYKELCKLFSEEIDLPSKIEIIEDISDYFGGRDKNNIYYDEKNYPIKQSGENLSVEQKLFNCVLNLADELNPRWNTEKEKYDLQDFQFSTDNLSALQNELAVAKNVISDDAYRKNIYAQKNYYEITSCIYMLSQNLFEVEDKKANIILILKAFYLLQKEGKISGRTFAFFKEGAAVKQEGPNLTPVQEIFNWVHEQYIKGEVEHADWKYLNGILLKIEIDTELYLPFDTAELKMLAEKIKNSPAPHVLKNEGKVPQDLPQEERKIEKYSLRNENKNSIFYAFFSAMWGAIVGEQLDLDTSYSTHTRDNIANARHKWKLLFNDNKIDGRDNWTFSQIKNYLTKYNTPQGRHELAVLFVPILRAEAFALNNKNIKQYVENTEHKISEAFFGYYSFRQDLVMAIIRNIVNGTFDDKPYYTIHEKEKYTEIRKNLEDLFNAQRIKPKNNSWTFSDIKSYFKTRLSAHADAYNIEVGLKKEFGFLITKDNYKNYQGIKQLVLKVDNIFIRCSKVEYCFNELCDQYNDNVWRATAELSKSWQNGLARDFIIYTARDNAIAGVDEIDFLSAEYGFYPKESVDESVDTSNSVNTSGTIALSELPAVFQNEKFIAAFITNGIFEEQASQNSERYFRLIFSEQELSEENGKILKEKFFAVLFDLFFTYEVDNLAEIITDQNILDFLLESTIVIKKDDKYVFNDIDITNNLEVDPTLELIEECYEPDFQTFFASYRSQQITTPVVSLKKIDTNDVLRWKNVNASQGLNPAPICLSPADITNSPCIHEASIYDVAVKNDAQDAADYGWRLTEPVSIEEQYVLKVENVIPALQAYVKNNSFQKIKEKISGALIEMFDYLFVNEIALQKGKINEGLRTFYFAYLLYKKDPEKFKLEDLINLITPEILNDYLVHVREGQLPLTESLIEAYCSFKYGNYIVWEKTNQSRVKPIASSLETSQTDPKIHILKTVDRSGNTVFRKLHAQKIRYMPYAEKFIVTASNIGLYDNLRPFGSVFLGYEYIRYKIELLRFFLTEKNTYLGLPGVHKFDDEIFELNFEIEYLFHTAVRLLPILSLKKDELERMLNTYHGRPHDECFREYVEKIRYLWEAFSYLKDKRNAGNTHDASIVAAEQCINKTYPDERIHYICPFSKNYKKGTHMVYPSFKYRQLELKDGCSSVCEIEGSVQKRIDCEEKLPYRARGFYSAFTALATIAGVGVPSAILLGGVIAQGLGLSEWMVNPDDPFGPMIPNITGRDTILAIKAVTGLFPSAIAAVGNLLVYLFYTQESVYLKSYIESNPVNKKIISNKLDARDERGNSLPGTPSEIPVIPANSERNSINAPDDYNTEMLEDDILAKNRLAVDTAMNNTGTGTSNKLPSRRMNYDEADTNKALTTLPQPKVNTNDHPEFFDPAKKTKRQAIHVSNPEATLIQQDRVDKIIAARLQRPEQSAVPIANTSSGAALLGVSTKKDVPPNKNAGKGAGKSSNHGSNQSLDAAEKITLLPLPQGQTASKFPLPSQSTASLVSGTFDGTLFSSKKRKHPKPNTPQNPLPASNTNKSSSQNQKPDKTNTADTRTILSSAQASFAKLSFDQSVSSNTELVKSLKQIHDALGILQTQASYVSAEDLSGLQNFKTQVDIAFSQDASKKPAMQLQMQKIQVNTVSSQQNIQNVLAAAQDLNKSLQSLLEKINTQRDAQMLPYGDVLYGKDLGDETSVLQYRYNKFLAGISALSEENKVIFRNKNQSTISNLKTEMDKSQINKEEFSRLLLILENALKTIEEQAAKKEDTKTPGGWFNFYKTESLNIQQKKPEDPNNSDDEDIKLENVKVEGNTNEKTPLLLKRT